MLERVAADYTVKTEQCNRIGVQGIALVLPFMCAEKCHVKVCFFFNAKAWHISMVKL